MDVEQKVSEMQTVIELGRVLRDRHGVPMKTPLRKAIVVCDSAERLRRVNDMEQYILEVVHTWLILFVVLILNSRLVSILLTLPLLSAKNHAVLPIFHFLPRISHLITSRVFLSSSKVNLKLTQNSEIHITLPFVEMEIQLLRWVPNLSA